jgi:hypothetical protein
MADPRNAGTAVGSSGAVKSAAVAK